MKRLISFTFAALLFAVAAHAQKFAFVDSDYILKNIPSYNAAQEELNKLSEQYEAEITTQYGEVEKMYKTYQSERVLRITSYNVCYTKLLRFWCNIDYDQRLNHFGEQG